MKQEVGAIVQARMSSQRFPGKVLYEVAGKPMLQYLLERLERCTSLDAIVVATSTEDSDTPIADYCGEHGVSCYRGSLSNVAERFVGVLERYQFDSFVRVNGDSPLLDQSLIDKAVEIHLNGNYEIVTNVLKRTYPKGQSVEVFRGDTFQRGYGMMHEDKDLEHVTRFFYSNSESFRIHAFAHEENLNSMQLSVDTRHDMKNFAMILSKMERPHWEYTLEDILRIHRHLM